MHLASGTLANYVCTATAAVSTASVIFAATRLRSCVTRERLLGRVSHMEEVAVPMLIPGITLNTTPTDYHAIKQMRLKQLDGARWVPLGDIISE